MGKTVLITGGSRGIGRETARLFAHNNWNVLINYYNSINEAKNLLNELLVSNPNIELFKADISRNKEVEDMVNHCVSAFGAIDVLVNNAGISQSKLFTDIEEEEWRRIIDINLTGTFFCAKGVLKHMINKKKGKIINISSIWGISGASCEVHYSAAKAGVIGLTKALAKEVGPSGIQVNCVAPGVTNTEMMKDFNEDEIDYLEEQIPLKRMCEPKEIAELIYFLASDKSDYITGQVISPNGGFII